MKILSRRQFIKSAASGLFLPAALRASAPTPFGFFRYSAAAGSSSDDPSNYSPAGWWKADSLSLSDGTAVGGTGNEWPDSSGGGRLASQASSGSQPIFRTNVFGSLPTIQFNGNHVLGFTELDLTSDFTVMAWGRGLSNQLGVGGGQVIWLGGNVTNNDDFKCYGLNGTDADTVTRARLDVATTAKVSNTMTKRVYNGKLVTMGRNGSNFFAYENATDITPGTPTISTATVKFTLLGGTSGVNSMQAELAEVVVFPSALTAANIASLYNYYFKTKWDLPATSALPNTITGLQLWLKADAIVGLSDGDPIGTWSDFSGNGNDATQASGSLKPTYKTSIINGLPVARFDSSDDAMATALSISGAPATYFLVYSANTLGGGKRVIQGSNNWLIGPYSGVYNYYNGGFASNAVSAIVNQFVVETIRATGGATDHWTNGVLRNSGGAGGFPGTIGLGASGASGERSDSDVAEIIIYNTSLSETDRKKVEAYLAQKYSLI